MKWNSVFVASALALLVTLGVDWVRRQASAAVVASNATDGLECEITSCDSTLVLGSPCVLGISLKNVSDHEIAVPRTAFGGITLTPPAGRQIRELSYMDGGSSEPEVLSANDLVRIKPSGVYRLKHTTYLAKDLADSGWVFSRYVPPVAAGKYQMQFTYATHYVLPREGLQLDAAKPRQGALTSSPVSISVVSLSAQEMVTRLLAGVKSEDANLRKLSMWAISFVTCRCFGENDGAEASIRALESWWNANKKASRQEWIVAALSSNEARDRQLAAERVSLVTDPRLRKELLRVLDPSQPDVSDKVFTALWCNFQDREAFGYARKMLSDTSYARRYKILSIVRDHKIEPLRDECQSAFISWLKAEKDPEALRHLVNASGGFKYKDSIPILKELDRKGQGPFKELIISLGTLKGKAYEPRLIEHLQGKEDEQRLWAAWSLSSYGTVASADPLVEALSDPNEEVRSQACRALGKLGLRLTADQYSAARSTLIEMLENDKKVNRNTIHNALVYITGVRPPTGTYSSDRRKAAEAWRGVTARRK